MKTNSRTIAAPRTVWRGRPYPLGATWDGEGVNFALYSQHAEKVELCLFDPTGRRQIESVELRERSDFVWHAYLPVARPGGSCWPGDHSTGLARPKSRTFTVPSSWTLTLAGLRSR